MDAISLAARRIAQTGFQEGAQSPLRPGPQSGGASFGDTFKQALEKVSEVQFNAQDNVNAFLRGEQVELHQVMAASEEAGIALEMLIEVRNKFAEAYRTVINMQS